MFVDGVKNKVFGEVDFAFESFGGSAFNGDVGFEVNGKVFGVGDEAGSDGDVAIFLTA